RRRGGHDAVRLRARIAPAHPRAACLGTAHEHCREPPGRKRLPPRRAEPDPPGDVVRARDDEPAGAAGDCRAGEYARRRRHVRLPRPGRQQRSGPAGRDLGLWTAKPVPAVERTRPMVDRRARRAQAGMALEVARSDGGGGAGPPALARPRPPLRFRPGLAMRSFLFLQGPLSPFFSELGRALIARGHSVHRVDLHLGEQIFWRLPASRFRGRFDEWRDYIGAILDEHRVTDMIMVGDRRPYHLVAAEEARARGIAVICTDFGYLRPGWVTFEYDGMTTYSRFPRDPAAIRELAAGLPEPDFHARFNAPFRLVAALDVAFTVPQVLGRPFYPHYRWHGIHHPFAEYAGWLAALVRRRLTRPRTKAAKAELQSDPGSYFLFPLQLATDFQLRANSPFADAREAVRHVVESFAASGNR